MIFNKFNAIAAFSIMNLLSFSVTIIDDFSNHNLKSTGKGASSVKINDNFMNTTPSTIERRANLSPNYSFVGDQLHYNSAGGSTDANISYTFSRECNLKDNSIKLNFANMSAPFTSSITIIGSDRGFQKVNEINFTPDQLESIIPLTAGGKGLFNPELITKITFEMNKNNVPDLTFDLDSIEAVPEPFSLISLGTGIAAFIKKKKKKANLVS